jgi:hypothetical protein
MQVNKIASITLKDMTVYNYLSVTSEQNRWERTSRKYNILKQAKMEPWFS